MRMKRTLVILAALTMAGAAAARAQTPRPAVPREAAEWHTVSVTGVGHVTLTPDRASFTAGVQTAGPTLTAATQENAARMTAVIAALKRAGAGEREIRTFGLSIYPQQAAQEGKPPRIVGYQVSNNVTVTKDDPAAIGRLIEAAVEAGANTVSGVTFLVSDPARGRDTGLQAAFADARAKADVLAKAAGRTAGRALAITEGGAPTPPMPMFRQRAEAMSLSMAAPVEAGAEELTFTVSVVFELQ
jgi:uncharacterized protein YggE